MDMGWNMNLQSEHDVNDSIGALELGDFSGQIGDIEWEGRLYNMGPPPTPTNIMTSCSAITKTVCPPRIDNDAALESAIQMGPQGPTSLMANCFVTKSIACQVHIDDSAF
jgi:hypothetical protein